MKDSLFSFTIQKRLPQALGRAGFLKTPHGVVETPAFVAVGTKATVKALTPEEVAGAGAQVVLGNTYHLYLEPGEETVKKAGGLGAFMHWGGPTMTDSGGFQVFSLGAGLGRGNTKFETSRDEDLTEKMAVVDEDGVTFRSPRDGSTHRFTPERSLEIQHALGADILFAFDECTLPTAPREYQREAMERTHRWAKRSLEHHQKLNKEASLLAEASAMRRQALFGIVQGGRHEDLRKESARAIGQMDFDGFGIGGSFSKEDLGKTLRVTTEILPEERPRHLLGIGEPVDMLLGIEQGIDTFDCVAPTRMGRTGTLYAARGNINIENSGYRNDFSQVEEGCGCYTCRNFTKAYLSHLFRAKEMLAATLASIHNLFFIISLVRNARQAILSDTFLAFRDEFIRGYHA